MSVLEFRGVTVSFGHGRQAMRAVDRVDLTVEDRQILGLVGESGSGKSTLARAAVGLVRPGAGRIMLDGVDVRGADHRRIQMVFQDPYSSLDPRMSTGTSIAEALSAGPRATRRAEVERLLELVGLDPRVARLPPGALSGGQRQRVALARGLAGHPDVLIADEITSALDVSVQGAVLNLVRDVQRQLGTAMMFISHNLATVRYLCDVIAVMYAGRIVEIASSDDLMSDPQHPYTRMLLRSALRLGETIDVDDEQPGDEPPDPHQLPSGCAFHPRCPVGPSVRPERTVCVDRDPGQAVADMRHRAACHFAEPVRQPSRR